MFKIGLLTLYWTKFLIGHLCFIQLFINIVKQFQKQYFYRQYGKRLIRVIKLYIQNINVISFILFAKIKHKEWPLSRDDQLELLLRVDVL